MKNTLRFSLLLLAPAAIAGAYDAINVTVPEGASQTWDETFSSGLPTRGEDGVSGSSVGSQTTINGSGTISMGAGEAGNTSLLTINEGANIYINSGNTLTIGYKELGKAQSGGWNGGDTTIKNNVEGRTSGFHLTGGATLIIYNTFKSNSGNASAGRNVLEMTGNNNSADIQGLTYLGGSNNLGGNTENIISVAGSNSSITFGGMVMGTDGTMSGSSANLLSVTGSNNSIINTGGFRGRFQIGFNLGHEAGSNTLYAKGDGSAADARVYVRTNNDLEIYGSNKEGSDVVNSAHFAGNATFANQAGTGAHNIKVGQSGNYGTSRLIVEGSGNDMKIMDIYVGAATQASSSKASFDIIGGGSDINIGRQFSVTAANGSSKDNQFGGIVNFTADSTGISTLNINSGEANISISGYLNIDFSNLSGEFAEEKFTLISFGSGIGAAKFGAWYDANSGDGLGANASFIFADSSTDSAYLKLETENGRQVLNAYYTSSVPEPAVCAAIFGALALAFASYRKKPRQ